MCQLSPGLHVRCHCSKVCLLWSWSRATLVSSHDLWSAIREAVNSNSGSAEMPERAELKTKWLFLTSCLIQRSLWFTQDTTHVLTLFQLKVLGEQELWLQETTLETFLGALVRSRRKSRSELITGIRRVTGFPRWFQSDSVCELLVRAGAVIRNTGPVDTLVKISDGIYSF